MTGLKRTMTAAFAAMLLTIAACGGGGPLGGGSDDPVGVVNAAIAAAESGGFQKLADFSCAANKDDFANAFGGSGDLGSLTDAGVQADELFSAMKVDFQDVNATESSKTDSEATVHIKGKIALTFDEAKMKEIIKKVLEAQGVPATDQMVDLAMSQMGTALSQTQDIDDDLKLIKENGKWVVCD
jgi:hypothetical protein